jgi:hypothetical protein
MSADAPGLVPVRALNLHRRGTHPVYGYRMTWHAGFTVRESCRTRVSLSFTTSPHTPTSGCAGNGQPPHEPTMSASYLVGYDNRDP